MDDGREGARGGGGGRGTEQGKGVREPCCVGGWEWEWSKGVRVKDGNE